MTSGSAAIARVADYLGVALANIVTVIGPERIVVGGGVMAGGERVLAPSARRCYAR